MLGRSGRTDLRPGVVPITCRLRVGSRRSGATDSTGRRCRPGRERRRGPGRWPGPWPLARREGAPGQTAQRGPGDRWRYGRRLVTAPGDRAGGRLRPWPGMKRRVARCGGRWRGTARIDAGCARGRGGCGRPRPGRRGRGVLARAASRQLTRTGRTASETRACPRTTHVGCRITGDRRTGRCLPRRSGPRCADRTHLAARRADHAPGRTVAALRPPPRAGNPCRTAGRCVQCAAGWRRAENPATGCLRLRRVPRRSARATGGRVPCGGVASGPHRSLGRGTCPPCPPAAGRRSAAAHRGAARPRTGRWRRRLRPAAGHRTRRARGRTRGCTAFADPAGAPTLPGAGPGRRQGGAAQRTGLDRWYPAPVGSAFRTREHATRNSLPVARPTLPVSPDSSILARGSAGRSRATAKARYSRRRSGMERRRHRTARSR